MKPVTSSRIWRPYTQAQIAVPPIPLSRAAGAYLEASDGRRIFDGISSWWVITHGHCHPALVDAVAHQAGKMDQVIFANFTHAPAEELADLLIEMTPASLTRVFLTDNGSTAVESALKMCIQACQQTGRSKRNKFITFSGAYHGDTVGAMSVSARGPYTRPYTPVLFDVLKAEHPTDSDAPTEDFVRSFRELMDRCGETICGVILEPLVQGAGGMIVWPAEALIEIKRLCVKQGAYLIFDEVMTGFGRTGRLFAMDHLNVAPDVLCLSKGITGGILPLAATLVGEELYSAFLSEKKTNMLLHGHSFTGNPISCAAAVANLKIFKSEPVLEKLKAIARIHEIRLAKIKSRAAVLNPRQCGTIAAFDIDFRDDENSESGYASSFSELATQFALKQNVFIRPLGNTVYLMPPYCSTSEDLHHAWNVIEELVGLNLKP